MNKLVKPIAFALICLISTAIALELSAFLLMGFQQQQVMCVYENSPEVGYKLARNISTRHIGAGQEYNYEINTNSRGERNREIDLSQPFVLSVGDSMAFGQGVGNEDTYSARLSELLNKPVVNAGVGGYNNIQALQTVEFYLEQDANIEFVIFQIFPCNDLVGNIIDIEQNPTIENGCIKNPKQPVTDIKSFFRENTYSYRFYAEKIRAVPILRDLLIGLGVMQGKRPPIYNLALENPPSELIERGWVKTEETLDELIELCEENDLELVVVSIPSIFQSSDALRKEAFDLYGVSEEGFDFDYPENRLEGYLAGKEVVFVNPLKRFREYGESIYFEYDPQLNEEGHRILAEEIFKRK
jgi:hypothetical protein